MPLINLEKETAKVKKSILFEEEVMNDIDLYAELLGKSTSNPDVLNVIVNEGLKYFMKKDKDFVSFKESKKAKEPVNNSDSTPDSQEED